MLEGLDATPVREELRVWKENFVNIQDLMDEYEQLKERAQLLRDEVCQTNDLFLLITSISGSYMKYT